MDWRKEYKVSDLFRRPDSPDGKKSLSEEGRKGKAFGQVGHPREGGSTARPPAPPMPGFPAPETSMWKKEIKLGSLFKRRKSKAPRRPLALPAPGHTLEEAPTPPRTMTSATPPSPPEAPGAHVADVRIPPPPPPPPIEDLTAPEARASAADASAEPIPSARPDAPPPGEAPGAPPKSERPERKGRVTKDSGRLPKVPLMKAVNLLPQDIKLPATTVRPVVARAALIGVAVLVGAGMGFFWWSQDQKLAERQGELEDMQAQLAYVEAQAQRQKPDDAAASALAGEAASRAAALSGAISRRLPWDRLLRELSLTLPDNVWFSNMSTATSTPSLGQPVDASAPPVLTQPLPSQITITGYALTQADVAQLLSRLSVIPEFDSVQLQSSSRSDLGGAKVLEFVVLGNLKPPALVKQ